MGVRITARPLSLASAYRELGDPGSGGIVVFFGRVRPDRTAAGRVRALRYEADRTMAVAELERIATTARRQFSARRTVLHHRIGRLPVGTVSVIVGAAAAHREDAFRAARFLIDALKGSAPIWKTDLLDGAPPSRRSARRTR